MKKKWTDLSREEQVALLEDYKKSTGPAACEKHGVDYRAVRGLLNYHAPKGMKKGGVRTGAGNKKGIKFCGKCRQTLKNCKCNE